MSTGNMHKEPGKALGKRSFYLSLKAGLGDKVFMGKTTIPAGGWDS
jgi:hypothetical protein